MISTRLTVSSVQIVITQYCLVPLSGAIVDELVTKPAQLIHLASGVGRNLRDINVSITQYSHYSLNYRHFSRAVCRFQ